MCFYITATLPRGINLEELQSIFNTYDMEFSIIQNEAVISQLRSGELYFRATKEYCDCETIIGSLNNLQEFQTLLHSKKVRTLKKKKWTDEEIDNWIKEKLRKGGKSTVKKLTSLERDEKIKRWRDFIYKILDCKKISRIGLLKHWYEKGLQNEEITITKTERANINKITSDFFLNMEEDVLYEFFISSNY